MAYVISDECVSCGACAAQCPAEAISEGVLISKSTQMHVLTVVLVQIHAQCQLSLLSNFARIIKSKSSLFAIGQAVLFCRKPSIVTSCQPNLLSSRLPLTNASVWTCYTLST